MRFMARKKSFKLSYRLVFYVVLCSSIFTLISTAIQLYTDYRRDVKAVRSGIEIIENSYLNALTSSLFNFDVNQTRTLLEGAYAIRDIEYIAVREDVAKAVNEIELGSADVKYPVKSEYQLEFRSPNGNVYPVGYLTVIASLDGVYDRLLEKVSVVLITNGLKTFIASIIILIIIQLTSTRHLVAMAEFTDSLDMNKLDQPLILNRRTKEPDVSDELDVVVTSINDMRERLRKGIEVQKKIEHELQRHRDDLEGIVKERTRELEELNQALKESRKDLQTLLENSPDLILRVNDRFKIQYLNRARKGIDKRRLIGKSVLDFISPEHLDEIKEKIRDCLNNAQIKELELKFNFNQVGTFWYQIRLVPLKRIGIEDEIMVISTNITRRIEIEKDLAKVQEELIDRAHRAGMAEIANGTLHNIGNILNSIRTSARMIENHSNSAGRSALKDANRLLMENLNDLENFILNNPKGKKLMGFYLEIEKVLDNEQELIDDNFARLNKSIQTIAEIISAQQIYAKKPNSSESIFLKDVVEDALTIQSDVIGGYGIEILKRYDQVSRLNVQKARLVHVIINLINNAKDAMALVPEDKRTLWISLEQTDECVELQLKDTGIGIKNEHLDKIFSHGFTTKEEGHGFGLHSCKTYIEEMGGKILVQSEGEGKGAVFTLQFPIANS